ncbi:MAG: phospholipase/carboxylesterase [Paraburkholderia sp.]|jgi:phospholipase/carboxylesterase|nr:phospholipase/carboxylesterase [Paraburkholderia sp.]
MKYFRKFLFAALLITFAARAISVESHADSENTLHTDLALPYLLHAPPKGDAGAPLIVLMHGMGSNERDLYSFVDALPSRYAVVSARGPYRLGDDRYEWFDGTKVKGKLDGNSQMLAASRARIKQFVAQLVKRYGFDSQQVYLVGFSQGAIMSYEVALTDPGAIRGIGVMSGAMFDSLSPLLRPSFALSHLHVFVSHGDADETIPIAYAAAAHERLRQLGIKPEYHVYPGMRHEISEAPLHDLISWLQQQP